MILQYYETNRLILKVLGPEYSHGVLHFYASNQAFFQPYDPPHPKNYYTTDYQRTALIYEQSAFKNKTSVRYYVFKKEKPQTIIGTISFHNIQYSIYQKAVIGYKFDYRHLRQGFAFESLQKGIEHIFSQTSLHRLEAYTMPANIASRSLLQKLGFVYEGIAFGYALIQNAWVDHEQFSLLSPTSLHLYE